MVVVDDVVEVVAEDVAVDPLPEVSNDYEQHVDPPPPLPVQRHVLTAAGPPVLTVQSPREGEEPLPVLTTCRPSPALTAPPPWTRTATRSVPRRREGAVTGLNWN